MGRGPSCCSGIDYVDVDTESRTRKARTIDMNGYSNRLELDYDELISRYSPLDGSLIIQINASSDEDDKVWIKQYKPDDFVEDLEQIQLALSEASENDSINVYLYENNPEYHVAVGMSQILNDYPLLIDVGGEFQVLLAQKDDFYKYVVINNMNYNLILPIF